MTQSLITLTTDFGFGSRYVAAMKGVIYSINPAAQVVDLTHAIAPQDVRGGAIALAEMCPWFPAETIHVAVVDPGVGSGRRIVGTAAVDAHARLPVAGREFKAPSYQEAFESVQTYAVTLAPLKREFEHDRRQVYSAYRNGRLYLVYPRVAAAPAFRFEAREGDQTAIMGQPIRLRRRAS